MTKQSEAASSTEPELGTCKGGPFSHSPNVPHEESSLCREWRAASRTVERPQQASPEQLPHNQELEEVRRQNEEYKLENEGLRRVIKDMMQGERSVVREGAEREAWERGRDAMQEHAAKCADYCEAVLTAKSIRALRLVYPGEVQPGAEAKK